MAGLINSKTPKPTDDRQLLAYVADLEMEVDRLRRNNGHLYQEARVIVDLARQNRDRAKTVPELTDAVARFGQALEDLREVPGYHPSHDQVVALSIRHLAEQVFRWQRRLHGVEGAELRLELDAETVEWFPARLRHILDSLVSNGLRYRDPDKAGIWVKIGLRVSPDAYELRVSDNGLGMPPEEQLQLFELFYRATHSRGGGMGVGLAVVKLLIEQSGGSLTVDSGAGQGSTFVAVLPRFDVNDFLS